MRTAAQDATSVDAPRLDLSGRRVADHNRLHAHEWLDCRLQIGDCRFKSAGEACPIYNRQSTIGNRQCSLILSFVLASLFHRFEQTGAVENTDEGEQVFHVFDDILCQLLSDDALKILS